MGTLLPATTGWATSTAGELSLAPLPMGSLTPPAHSSRVERRELEKGPKEIWEHGGIRWRDPQPLPVPAWARGADPSVGEPVDASQDRETGRKRQVQGTPLPFFTFFSSSPSPAPKRVKMIPVWELMPTAVTTILPEPSITWVPARAGTPWGQGENPNSHPTELQTGLALQGTAGML